MEPRTAAALVAAVAIAAAALELFPLRTCGHFWDECVYLQHARILLGHEANYSEMDSRPPALPALLAAAFALTAGETLVAHLAVAALSVLGVLGTFLVARSSFGERAGWVAALLLLLAPGHLFNARLLHTDVPSLALSVAALALAMGGAGGGALRPFLSGALAAAAVLARFNHLLTLALLPLAIPHVRRSQGWRAQALGAAAVLLPWALATWLRFGAPLYPLARALSPMGDEPVDDPLFYPRALPALAGTTLALGAALALGDRGVRDAPQAPALLAWAVLYLAAMGALPHKEPRYVLPTLPPLAALAGGAYASLTGRLGGRWALALVVGLALLDGWREARYSVLEPFPSWCSNPTRDAALYLRSAAAPHDTVYASSEAPVLAFYSERRTVSVPYDLRFLDFFPERMTEPGFLVAFPRTPKLPRPDFLDSHGQFVLERDFGGGEVLVYRYAPSGAEKH